MSACRAWAVAQLEHCLPGLHEAPCLIPNSINKIWCRVPVIPTLRKWRQENQEFKVVLGYTFSFWPPGIQEGVGDRLTCRLNPLYPAFVSSVLLGTFQPAAAWLVP